MNTKLYKLMDWPAIEGIIYADCSEPQKVLGVHAVTGGNLIQCYFPDVESVSVCAGNKEYKMELVDEEGFFALLLAKTVVLKKYYYKVTKKNGKTFESYDPYNFKSIFSQTDIEKFKHGIHYNLYEVLGSHVKVLDGIKGVLFSVWAPNALSINLVGDFNKWNTCIHPMKRIEGCGVFELFMPMANANDNYQYLIKIKGGEIVERIDPFAQTIIIEDKVVSTISDNLEFQWNDADWFSKRKNTNLNETPLSIFKFSIDEYINNKNCVDNAFDLAKELVAFVKKNGFTHVEFMPFLEQTVTVSPFSFHSIFATKGDLKKFINIFHEVGVGVLIDWNCAFFSNCNHGLNQYDGSSLFEVNNENAIYPFEDATYYDLKKLEVKNYLLANAFNLVREFHIDGLKLISTAAMLYLDYGKQNTNWVPNIYGGKDNLDAVEFFKHLNSILKLEYEDVLVIAGDTGLWPNVTGSVENNELGFDFTWNVGYQEDFLKYMQCDPIFRSGMHGELTLSMVYAYSEKFLLTLSKECDKDQIPLFDLLPGDEEVKFNNLKLMLAYLFMHPGKKVIQTNDLEVTDKFSTILQNYVAELAKLYHAFPALYELDSAKEGFNWMNAIASEDNVISFLRNGKNEKESLLVLFNFSGNCYSDYRVGVPKEGKYKEVFNSDLKKFHGNQIVNHKMLFCEEEECDNREQSIVCQLGAFSCQAYKFIPFTDKEIEERKIQKEIIIQCKQEKKKYEAALNDFEIAKQLAVEAKKKADEADLNAKEALKFAMQESKKAQELDKNARDLEKNMEKIIKESKYFHLDA